MNNKEKFVNSIPENKEMSLLQRKETKLRKPTDFKLKDQTTNKLLFPCESDVVPSIGKTVSEQCKNCIKFLSKIKYSILNRKMLLESQIFRFNYFKTSVLWINLDKKLNKGQSQGVPKSSVLKTNGIEVIHGTSPKKEERKTRYAVEKEVKSSKHSKHSLYSKNVYSLAINGENDLSPMKKKKQ